MTTALFLMLLTAGPPKVASPEWNVVDVKKELAAFYAEHLAEALRGEGLSVATSADIATLLTGERQRQLLGCDDAAASCLAELANALGCEATLTVSLAKLGGGFRGLAKLMSSRDGSILSSVKIEAGSEDALLGKLDAAAKVLAAPLRRVMPMAPAPRFWWLPGAFGLLGLGSGGLMIGLANGKYDELSTKAVPAATAQGFVADGQRLQTAGWIATSVGAAAVAASVGWLLFGPREVQPQVTLAPGGVSFGVGGRF